MQRPVRVSEAQLLALFDKARNDYAMAGFLSKRSADSAKWKLRWFTLYQNILFYNDSDSGKLLGIIFLEGCYCEPLVSGSCAGKQREPCDRQHCFVIKFRREDLRHYVFQAETDSSCYTWIEAIEQASFNKVLLMKEELEQKHLHLLQIVESEKTARCQYTLQCEELSFEVKKLRSELCALKKEGRPLPGKNINQEKESDEIRKIKKVQSFFRGWLCRRRWKQIVEEYIRSPHAENMRKRNSLVFRMVEEEERYVEQLHLLISCYLRPFKMAASSKTPPCSHDDVNSIFLNSETVLFLHQIFLKGLTARMESWPTLVLGMHKIGDLFDMLLPMLSIYQEYVRNHHYSLQVLAECKQSPAFVALLKRLEEKPNCQNRSLETFLTYPMHQIPRYITTLHELLAHTPHNHVERKSLENARTKLEELSRQMHDEVSETENIRKNLSIERMIVEGCDILLDVNQVFVRQGTLIQLPTEKPKGPRNRIGSFKSSDKEVTRQCFLFTNHLILTTRTSSGRLHLVQGIGKIPLADATLIEDPSEHSIIEDDGESSVCSGSSHSSGGTENQPVISKNDYQSLDFKLIIDVKSGPSVIIHLLAAKLQEKNAWISDISHCMDNVHFNDLFHGSTSNTSSVTMPQSIRNDPRLFKDDIDIRFSRTLNSCKVPQIRYATPERLLERLTDLRFLSIDFLNTFLLTYRVFTNGVTVLEALKHVYYNPEVNDAAPTSGISESQPGESVLSPEYDNMRRISTSSVVSSVEPGEVERERSLSHDSRNGIQVQHWRWSHRKFEEEQQHREMNENATNTKNLIFSNEIPDTSLNNKASTQPTVQTDISISDSNLLNVPSTLAASTSLDTLTETAASSPSTPQALSTSTNTLVAEAPEESVTEEVQEEIVITKNEVTVQSKQLITMSSVESTSSVEEEYPLSPPPDCTAANSQCLPPSHSSQNIQISYYSSRRTAIKRGSADTSTESSITSPRSSFQLSESPQHSSRAGVVITSHRASQRRSSTSSAAAAFAVATAGSSNPRDLQCQTPRGSIGHRYSTVSTDSRLSYRERLSICKRESIISTAATMRVLNVLRHWVSKHSQDFESNSQLKSLTIEFLEELLSTASLLPVEQKAASQLLRMITRENSTSEHVDLDMLLATPTTPSKESIETLQALDIAEQMTYLDHKIFISIRSEEFLGQAWNKPDKAIRAPNIHLMSQRFNDVCIMSRLVASEIIRHSNLSSRIAVIEKWTAVADICRCFHNFNGVFQIASAFECSAIFRLKKTWEKIPKTHRQTIEKIKNLASYDGRFRNLRESLHRCDPPCIPFLGMYLSDLSFIEEGTPNFTEDNLLNFSKMRMVANYLLDPSLLLSDEELYNTSLAFEPRTSRLGSISHS